MELNPNDPEIAISRIRTAIWKLEAENKDKRMQIDSLSDLLETQNKAIKELHRVNSILFLLSFLLSFALFWVLL